VLFDVVTGDRRFGDSSREALRRCRDEGTLVACDVVWAEMAAAYPSAEAARHVMESFEVAFDPLGEDASLVAGQLWAQHCRQAPGRQRILPDFLIGAHALTGAEQLLTRDRGFYRRYFEDLPVLDPSH
jgi:predicted nucleic acid-binding protein